MAYILILLIAILSTLLINFINNYNLLKKEHIQATQKLQSIIDDLKKKNKLLTELNRIKTNYDLESSTHTKIIGNEIVELQKMLFKTVSN